jgi:HPr kinase/phosphorylase
MNEIALKSKLPRIRVKEFWEDNQQELRLEIKAGEKGLSREVTSPDVSQPGVALSGHFTDFQGNSLQVFTPGECSFLNSLSPEVRRERLSQLLSYPIPGIIISQNSILVPELEELGNKNSLPIFTSPLSASELIRKLISYLEENLAPEAIFHGALVDVYSVGILILGKSGVGKTECALTLVKSGHRLVADDVIKVKKIPKGELIGYAPEITKHFMELKGLGIVNIRLLYGSSAVVERKTIELVAFLELWDTSKQYEQLGLEEEETEILGVKLPKLVIPVRPGRNIPVIIEAAAMNYQLKQLGIYPAREMDRKLIEKLQKACHDRRES